MKTWKKLLIAFLVFCFLLALLKVWFPKDETSIKSQPEKAIAFDSLSLEEKDKAVTDFIFFKDYKDTRFKVNEFIRTALSQSVKYPETIEYFYNNEWVDGSETYVFSSDDLTVDSKIINRITVIVNFRSENNFSQKVRNKFKFTFDFKGNEPIKFVESKVL